MPNRRFDMSIRTTGAWVAETVFCAGVLLAGLLAVIVVIGSVEVFASAAITVMFLAVAVIAAVHHAWYAQHRDEIVTSHAHQVTRERRGY